MGKTFKDSQKDKFFTNKSKTKQSNTKNQKDKKTNKRFDYLNSEYD
jgi:hypothetical protein